MGRDFPMLIRRLMWHPWEGSARSRSADFLLRWKTEGQGDDAGNGSDSEEVNAGGIDVFF